MRQTPSWADNPIHDKIRQKGLDTAGLDTTEGSLATTPCRKILTMKMFCDMSIKERRFYMIASLNFLKRIREYGGPHGLAAAYGKRANEERFRKLWRNRHNEVFDFNA